MIPFGLWSQSSSTHYKSVDPGSFTHGGYGSKSYAQNFIVNTWYCAPLQKSMVYSGQSGMPSGFIFGRSVIIPPTPAADSLVCVSDTSWRKSTVTTTSGADSYPWPGAASLPAAATFTLPVMIGQPYGYKTIEEVTGTDVIKTGSAITYFRKTFSLSVDTGVMARFRAYMDDGMEIYLNGILVSREDDRASANRLGVSHDLLLGADGSTDNGFMGGDPFDVVTTMRMDSLVKTGTNELIVVIRNKTGGDLGGFSFRMDLKTGIAAPPVLVDSCVADASWHKSTFSTPITANSYPWPGAPSLPSDATFTLPVSLGQPYGYHSIDMPPGSSVIKASANITYYRKTFVITDSADLNFRIRAAFDDNMEVYLNRKLLLREEGFGAVNRQSPFHDVHYASTGVITNGYLGADAFTHATTVDLDTCLKLGENSIIVAIRNRSSDIGGFSFRLDIDKGGTPVIIKKTEPAEEEASKILGLKVYPNPVRSFVNVEIPSLCRGVINDLIVTNGSGRILHHQKITGKTEVDMRNLSNGVYIIQLQSAHATFSKRVLKQ